MRVLLTGGRGGIGRSIKNELVSRGCSVVAPTSDELDLSSQTHVLEWIEANSDLEFDGLVLCAGTNSPRDFDEVETNEYLRILETNVNSNRFLIKAVLPAMKKNRYGRIIAISSSYSTITRLGRSSYSISKAALEALIRSVGLENAQNNILANSVVPGFIETPLTVKNNDRFQLEKILERIPMGHMGKPSDVAKLVWFLMSEQNTYITGQSIRIDGGFSIN
jgi:NAD(P)-dependent dehydrogenase (short-subunit alcohol dehydrogenase family)